MKGDPWMSLSSNSITPSICKNGIKFNLLWSSLKSIHNVYSL